MSVYDDTYQCWGVKNQFYKFSEELFELGTAMHHWYDDKITDEEFADEIADVEIVVAQLTNLMGHDLVSRIKAEKLTKLRKDVEEWLEKQKPLTVQGTQWSASPSAMLRNISAFPKSILNSNFIKSIQSRITK
jgi:NTP pyrophosphatase (non-canonical NTP hydrolase)